MPQPTPIDSGPSSPAPSGERERDERLDQPRSGRQEFFMDIPRAGARERERRARR
jgi:hypothetical protein